MAKKPVIVIRCVRNMTIEEWETIHRVFAKQFQSGVLLLPNDCELVGYPESESAYIYVDEEEDNDR